MSVTIYDVAKEAGVSISTVSKALSDSFSIPETTKQRVRNAANRLEYRPNARAKNFAKQSTGTVMFLTDLYQNIAFENPHLMEIICGVTRQLGTKGYTVLLKTITKQLATSYMKQVIQEHSVDGIVIHANILTEESIVFLLKCDYPYLVIGKPETKTNICWLDVNHEQAGELAANYLLDCGYRNIAYLYANEDSLSRSRLTGMERATSAEGGRIQRVHCQSSSLITDETLEALLGGEQLPEVLLCSNNYLAFHCVQYINRKRLRMPEDIAMLTFDNYPFSYLTEPKLSAVDIDMNDLGVNAAQFILQRIKKPSLRMQSYCTSPHIIERETT